MDDDSDPEFKAFSTRYSRLNEQDLALRKCPKKYDLIRELESKVMTAARAHLRTYVICPGIVYGHGEDVLFNYFR
jgi:adenylate kinase